MSYQPKFRLRYGEGVGVDIFVQAPDISEERKTFFSDDAAVGTSFSVDNGLDFAVSEYIVAGPRGAEKTEIVKIHTATVPTASAITLDSTSLFSHNRGDIIQFIPYNQIVIQKSTDGGLNYSDLATINIRVDATETYYQYTSGISTDYYRVKFYNSTSTLTSQPSDGIPATGWLYNAVGAIKKRALLFMGESIGSVITDEFLNEALWEGRREVDNQLKRWSWRTSFNTNIGTITEGMYSLAVPATLRNPDSPQNVLNIQNGKTGRHISYVSKNQFNIWYEGVRHTTVLTQPSVGATSLVLLSVRDLEASGSININGNIITYTAKVNSTGTISGIPASGDGSITATHAVGTDAWQFASFGEPYLYTIFEDTIFFNAPFDSTFEGYNIWADFYRTLPAYDSDSDILDEPDVDMFVSYLKHRIAAKKLKEKYDKTKNSDYADYIARLAALIRKETLNQNVRMVPDIGHLVNEE